MFFFVLMVRIKLLDEQEQFTKETESVLNEIFSRFDIDKDGALSFNELQEFAIKTNGSEFSNEAINEIQTYFDCIDSKLTKKGFYEMYFMQTVGDEDETRKDFGKHGFTEFE